MDKMICEKAEECKNINCNHSKLHENYKGCLFEYCDVARNNVECIQTTEKNNHG